MAHEMTHVVQQGAAVRRTADGPKHEEGGQPVVRRSIWDKITGVAGAVWDNTGGRVKMPRAKSSPWARTFSGRP